MIYPSDIMTAVNALLKAEYPDIKRYGSDTVDGAKTPYFFVEAVDGPSTPSGLNFRHRTCNLKITYIPGTINQHENLMMANALQEKFGLSFKVKDRRLDVQSYTYDFIGTSRNILQITVAFNWHDNMYAPDDTELMEHLIPDFKD